MTRMSTERQILLSNFAPATVRKQYIKALLQWFSAKYNNRAAFQYKYITSTVA